MCSAKRQGYETRTCLRRRVCSQFCHNALCGLGTLCPFLGFLSVSEGPGPDGVWGLFHLWYSTVQSSTMYQHHREPKAAKKTGECDSREGIWGNWGALNPPGGGRGRIKESFLRENIFVFFFLIADLFQVPRKVLCIYIFLSIWINWFRSIWHRGPTTCHTLSGPGDVVGKTIWSWPLKSLQLDECLPSQLPHLN